MIFVVSADFTESPVSIFAARCSVFKFVCGVGFISDSGFAIPGAGREVDSEMACAERSS